MYLFIMTTSLRGDQLLLVFLHVVLQNLGTVIPNHAWRSAVASGDRIMV